MMRRSLGKGAALAVGVALLGLMIGGHAAAQKAVPFPTPTPTRGAPPPAPAPAPTPTALPSNPQDIKKTSSAATGPEIDGIAVGAPFSVVDAKCKEAGVKCVRATRRAGVHQLDRVRMVMAAPKPFTRVVVTGKGGTVLSVRGSYRVDDQNRLSNMVKALGAPATQRRGMTVWAPPSSGGIVTELDLGGRAVQYIDTKAASGKGIGVNPQLFAAAPSLASLKGGSASASGGGGGGFVNALPGFQKAPRLGQNALPIVFNGLAPQVTNPLKIPVKITLLQLKCFDENDLTSVFHGDDPWLQIVGTHTSPSFPVMWQAKKEYSDVESGNTLNVNVAVFPENDARRFVTFGEAVGVQVTLFESDSTSYDDQIDFTYPIIDYATAVANQGKTLNFDAPLTGDGTEYRLTYKVEIQNGVADPSAMSTAPRYHTATVGSSPQGYAGNYAGTIGDSAAEATLSFVASKDPAYPNGVLNGTMKDGATASAANNAKTTRLQGNSIELVVNYSSGSPGWISGYLIGDASSRRLVGTLMRDGTTRGVLLTKK